MNIRTVLLALALIACTFTLRAQEAMDYDKVVGKFQQFYNYHDPDSIFYMFSDKIKTAMPLKKTVETFNKLNQQLGFLSAFRYTYEKDGMLFYTMIFSNTALTLMVKLDNNIKIETFRLLPYQSDSARPGKSNFFLKTAKGNIYGTLTTPPGMNKVPVVLIIPGSGPTDRNGNSTLGVNANTYKMIADSLQKEGIASLRYDKRGVAESAAALENEDSLTFDDGVNDAIGFTKMLKQYWRFTKVVLLGHSEGSLIGMRVAEQEKVDGYISVAGVAQRADKIIETQFKAQSKELSGQAKVYFDSLLKGYSVHVPDNEVALASVFRTSAQGYIRSWLHYTPEDEIKKLTIPILILQGTTDIQVAEKEAKKLAKAAPDATLTIIDGMNHVLKQAPEDRAGNGATYTNPDLPLSPGLMPAITSFVKGLK
jgi:pimeloyl-ACP methyl ester carboxylesterase